MLMTQYPRRRRSPVALPMVILCLFMLSTMLVRAQPMIPHTVSYQGRVTVEGQPFHGIAYAKFAITDAFGATTWSNDGSSFNGSEPETAVPIEVRNGVFSMLLGESAPLLTQGMEPLSRDAFPDGECTLLVWFSTDGVTFSPLGPPRPIAAVPYAYVAADADTLDGLDSADFALAGHTHFQEHWEGAGYGLSVLSTTAIGIHGSTDGTMDLVAHGVLGSARAATGNTRGVTGRTMSPSGVGVEGSGPTKGVLGVATADAGTGVYGYAESLNGSTRGMVGRARSPWGIGVLGVNHRGIGVEGTSDDGTGVAGTSVDGTGVVGSSEDDIGVLGRSWDGTGVSAYSRNGLPLLASGYGAVNLIEAYEEFTAADDLRFRVSRTGNVHIDGTYNTGGADMAELLPAVAGLEPGDVLAIGLDGDLVRSSAPYQTAVAGVYSTKPGILGGAGGAEGSTAEGQVPLAILGVVPTKVSAENGAIAPGDLLTTSATPGYAMRAGSTAPMGTILGKALEPLAQGTGVIRVLVTLH